MDYWDIGHDPERGRYGIPAREHPDYRGVARALAEVGREMRVAADAHLVLVMEAVAAGDPDAVTAVIEDPAFKEANRARYARMRELGSTVPADLYRRSGSSLAVRYDRVGKYAWEREFRRLGWAGRTSERRAG